MPVPQKCVRVRWLTPGPSWKSFQHSVDLLVGFEGTASRPGREGKKRKGGEVKEREGRESKERVNITHCSFANLRVLGAIYSTECKTRIQTTDSLYHTISQTK